MVEVFGQLPCVGSWIIHYFIGNGGSLLIALQAGPLKKLSSNYLCVGSWI